MANVLGSLLVLLRADTAEFSAGMSKAAREAKTAGKEIEESFSRLGGMVSSALAPFGELGAKISETFSKVGEAASAARVSTGAMGAAAAGAVAGIVGMGGALVATAFHAAEVGNQIYEAGEKTGLSTKMLQGLMAITKETGGSFDELSTALGRAEANLAKGELAGSKANKILLALQGGAKGAAELGLKPMDDRLQILLKRIFDMNDVGQRNLALTTLMGKGWQGNVETLKAFAESADGGAAAAARLGLTMDPAQAHNFVIQMNLLKAQLDGVALSIGSQLVPALADAMAGLRVWSTVWADAGAELVDVGRIIAAVATHDFGAAGLAAADLVKQKTAIQDALKGATDEAKNEAAAVAGDTDATNQLTDATKHHETALERLAKQSHDFWEEYNAGLTNANEKYPKVISLANELMKALHPGEIQMPTGQWRELPDVGKTMSQIQELQKGGLAKGPPGGMDPFRQIGATLPQSVNMWTINFDQFMAHIQSEGPKALSPMRQGFDTFFEGVAEDGANFSGKMIDSFSHFTAEVSRQLASLVVTGRTNFRSLFMGLEQEVIQSGIQAIFAKLATSLISSSKPTPSPATATGAASAGAGFIGKIFGGFLQHGGDVTPGRAYVVGERHAEFFVPNQAGQVRPTLAAGAPHQTVVNFHVNGVQDYDSFRRSSSQIMALMQNQMATAYSRNR